MKYRSFSYKIRARYLLNIFFLILILGLKLSNYLSDREEHYEFTIPTYNELVFSEHAREEQSFKSYSVSLYYILDKIREPDVSHSYKNAILTYNKRILLNFRVLNSNPIYNSNIISFMQCNNIWHKSTEKEPGISC